MNCSVLWQNYPCHTGAFGNAQQRTQVARVGYSVNSQQERSMAIDSLEQFL
jgi:hypothetical protein